MDEVKSTHDIDTALEATAGVILGIDTVAIFYPDEGMYGIYVHGKDNDLWWLQATSLTIENISGG
mgnify:CR=1 FL=1